MADYITQIYDSSVTPPKYRDVADAQARKNILYYTTSTGTSNSASGEILRFPASGSSTDININTVLLNISFSDPSKVTSNISWESITDNDTTGAGHISIKAVCSAVITAYVTLGRKGN